MVGEGEGGMIWENNIETYKLTYVKEIVSVSLMCNVGNRKPVITWKEEVGRELEGGSKEGGVTYTPMTDSCWCMAEAITIL